ncbi:MAG: hypothetical protein ABI950_05125 [Solirubrobacteraceae bacterium]
MALRDNVRRRAIELLQGASSAAAARETSRETLLALAEISRRVGGDVPNAGLDLAPYELRVLSQNGEDGILAEILRRVGTTNRYFVEFGAGDGTENNCVLLADVFGWNGLFMEGGEEAARRLSDKYAGHPRIVTRQALVSRANVEGLFREAGVPVEPDVLSIDIDSDDYWVWQGIESFRPRVVVVEYNASLGSARQLVRPEGVGGWDVTDFYSASIAAFKALAGCKGYRIVHCDLPGNSAFFVREDATGEFLDPDDVLLRAPNYYLLGMRHRPDPQQRSFVDVEGTTSAAS